MPKFRWTIELEQRVSKLVPLEFEAESIDHAIQKVVSFLSPFSNHELDRQKLMAAFPELNMEYDTSDDQFEPNTDWPDAYDVEGLEEIVDGEQAVGDSVG